MSGHGASVSESENVGGPGENIREIPYNYTSYSDREIVLRFLGPESWDDLNALRSQRRTGRSARKLFEILGDVWVISRNAFLKEALLSQPRRLAAMRRLHEDRLRRIEEAADGNARVLAIVRRTREMLDAFHQWFAEAPARRKRVAAAFARHTHRNNIHFDAYTLTHHATDATDWRQEHPFCVITPDAPEEIPGLVRAARELGMTVIPRGGGTGLCGGSVPLHGDAVMINVEKLDAIGPVREREVAPGRKAMTITAQAGAVTGKVMEASRPHIFATDPTSLWACTIGGNVASNAGGKHAVIWGTCVDNLLSWKMVTPDGNWLTVERLEHNMGKIPADGEVRFRLSRARPDGSPLGEDEILTLPGAVFRRAGLGKDVTRKALGGLPGVQKEGVDGFITEATFVLHEPFKYTQTVCCEFFGHDLTAATRAMVDIKNHVDAMSGAHLEGLEHFDEKYVKATGYKSKSTRRERPRVVLLIDVSGNNKRAVAKASADICRIASRGNGEGFIAISEEDRKSFWEVRGQMAAIARHTRAFKLNEDVVIPLDRLSEYNDFIERLNIENSIANKLEALDEIDAFLRRQMELVAADDPSVRDLIVVASGEYLTGKLRACLEVTAQAKRRWRGWLAGLDEPASAAVGLPEGVTPEGDESLFRLIQRGGLRVSYRREVERPLLELLRGYPPLIAGVRAAHARALSRRIVIATHMHAGDGNVHTNVPVNSNDYEMMKRAHAAVEAFMAKAVELGGVISGEHGIGITKLPYMPRELLEEMREYKRRVDPDGVFNRGKLLPDADLTFTYTPSFNLLEMEAVILEAADMTALSEEISPCLRCGKCKPVCNTHFPRADMLYSPRNKIQAAGAIIEAFLYESQTGNGISFAQFAGLADVADHCTICHKCVNPCPVNIDFGEVTERMRAILKDKGQARPNLGARLSLLFLTLRHPDAVKLMRRTVINWGYAAHRLAHRAARALGLVRKRPAARRNLSGVPAQVISFVERPLPKPPLDTARTMLGIDGRNPNEIPILRDPERAESRAVFYFPGCGSERLFSQVGLATQAMLFELGLNVVLPPSYLCCGYPSTAGGDAGQGAKITYDNRVLFHRIRTALAYLDFEAVIVSCGTCYDQLTKYQLEQVFPDAPLIDIHEYLMAQGVKAEGVSGRRYIYHEPCHTPLKRHGSEEAIRALLGSESVASPECCGEAGTLAVAKPAIAGKIRARKEEEMARARERIADEDAPRVLTSCPSCLQGLSRLEGETGVEADYIVVELARHLHGEDWQRRFIERVRAGGIERVLM